MAKIGFKAIDENQKKDSLDSLEYLGRVLREVEQESYQLESDLKEEIKNLDHLKENIKILEEQVAEAEIYLQKRRKLVLEVLAMESAPYFEISIAKDLLTKINHFNEIIGKKINLVSAEIRKYILNEAAQILTENVQHQGQMEKIDQIARKLLAAVTVISSELSSHQNSLKELYQKVKIRENQPKVRNKNGIGY